MAQDMPILVRRFSRDECHDISLNRAKLLSRPILFKHLKVQWIKKVFIHHVFLLIPFYYIEQIYINDAFMKNIYW
jgi:hypothetical protein